MRVKTVIRATAVLIFAFFFLPWFSVTLNGRGVGQFSGYQLAVGIGRYAIEGLNGRSVFLLVPLFALVVLLLTVIPLQSRFWPIVSASGEFVAAWGGLLVLIWLWRGGIEEVALTFSVELGFILTLLGFFILLICALFSFVKGWRSIPDLSETASLSDTKGKESGKKTEVSQTTTHIIPIPEYKTEPSPQNSIPENTHKSDVITESPALQAWLVVLDGDFKGAKFHIVPPVRIGRDAGNDIIVDDTSMSGYHAVIREQGGAFHIQDLNSTNGIYLENQSKHRWQRVPAATLVNDMVIKLGRTAFQVVIEGNG